MPALRLRRAALASAARRRAARLSARQRQFSAGEFPLLQQAGRRARSHDPGRMGRRLYRPLPGRSETGLCQLSRRDRPPGGGEAGSQILVRPHPFESEEVYRGGVGPACQRHCRRHRQRPRHDSKCRGRHPSQLRYGDRGGAARKAADPARISQYAGHGRTCLAAGAGEPRPPCRSRNCSPWSTTSTGKRAKFDFAGVHAADIHAFFHRNDGWAAERVADVLVGADRPTPALRLAFKRAPGHAAESEPRADRQGRRQPAVRIGGDGTAAHLVQSGPARQAHRTFRRRRLLERIAAHDKCDPSLFSVERARCAKTGLPLASIAIEKRPERA